MIIYRITNSINGKSYIGQTKNKLKYRWKDHCRNAEKDNNNYFYNAIRKYGTECWTLETLEEVKDVNLLNEREIYWIEFYNTFKDGYNLRSGGGQRTTIREEIRKTFGRSRTEEQKTHHSEMMKGSIPWNKGRKGLQKAWNKGISPSEETRKKQSIAKLGNIPWNKNKQLCRLDK
jgi:group I intron endonuclease